MKTSAEHDHGIVFLSLLLFSLSPAVTLVGAQPAPPGNSNGNQYPYAAFNLSTAIIFFIIVSAFLLTGLFSIYIGCGDFSSASGTVRRALSPRNRRAAAARGLEPLVIETFPTFSYSEVKDHKNGKGALECAVCLNEFEEDETLRLLPKCDHVFHSECIDAWLESHATCPVCRANLAPLSTDELAQASEPIMGNVNAEIGSPRNDEIVIPVDENQRRANPEVVNQSSSLHYLNRPRRSWSIRRPIAFGFGKFRSNSTGHSLVQPGDNLDRFTLRLPEEKRKEMMDRAESNQTGSSATTLPREASARKGYRTGGEEGSSRAEIIYRRNEDSDREVKADRWVYFARGLPMRSPKVMAETDGASGSSGELSSSKGLEPKAVDATGLTWNDSAKSPVRCLDPSIDR